MSILKKLTKNQRFIYEVVTDPNKFLLIRNGHYYECHMIARDGAIIEMPVRIVNKDVEDLYRLMPDLPPFQTRTRMLEVA